ncbi:hypothetical protein [Parasphaerochaeta coccoides]|uniref:Uncharacterized protein n=1 Tax=Parasphaerochaeta coccoides (strain ATCC BAA-1237 / DSM 17374 / SPN1) TaxID=760011 RepID=F4GKS7_PARC1|nr:hypothetical protein [Parasphaerochaeta coccoides]AEC01486.1 hypothetical protein Spico_0254 [Parasphaerochaeta coccoides DSM 17374]
MSEYSPDELREAYRALLSLRNKNDKASSKLKEGSWQSKLTTGIVKAADTAIWLINGADGKPIDKDLLDESRIVLADALRRSEDVIGKFAVGTSQHTLQERRIAALKIALSLIEREQSL